MLSAKLLKQCALEAGADAVAIGPVSRYEGAPKQFDVRYILPGCKSIIGLAFRHLRGVFRGIEEGTFFSSYSGVAYASINCIRQPMVLREICRWIEDQGYDTMPIPNHFGWGATNMTGQLPHGQEQVPMPENSRPLREGLPSPNLSVHMRLGAVISGLGEIGWSKMFLTKEFGPRQRIALLLTDAEFEYDPIVKPGTICDRCKLCAKACSGNAIPTDNDKVVRVVIDGVPIEWADIDYTICSRYFCGASPQHNPFVVTAEDREKFAEPVGRSQNYKLPPQYFYARALEGAAGCIRACMMHLEQTGRINNTFEKPFRRKPSWRMPTAEQDKQP